MEEDQTIIYVIGVRFQQYKYRLLNIPIDEISSFNDIKSINETKERQDNLLEYRKHITNNSPEVEFWGHCLKFSCL